MTTVRVWDLPTRVFHWCLVLCFVGLVTTGQIGGEYMDWHFRFGYSVLSLLLFRMVWGFVGGRWSRFSVFVVSPVAILRYLQSPHASASVGHSPLGALSVLALLIFPLLQVATGLISDDEIATTGPLSKYVSSLWVSKATYYHSAVGQYVLYGLVLLHIAAIVFYQVKRKDNLLAAMLHGDKVLDSAQPPARDDVMTRAGAVLIFSMCVGLVFGVVQWAD